MMVSDHIRNLQILNSNSAELGYHFPAQLMQEITPLVNNPFIEFSQSKACFNPIFASFNFSAYSSVQKFQFAFTLDKMARISYKLSIGESSKVLYANINADFAVRIGMNGFAVRQFTGEYSKPFISFGMLDSESFNLAFRYSVQDDWQTANLGNFNVLVADELKTRLRKCNAHNSGLVAGKTFFLNIFFDTPKEVLKGFVNPIRNILFGLGMNALKFSRKIFVEVKLVKRNIAKIIGIFIQGKKFVINHLTGFKRINQPNFLFSARINLEFIHQQAHISKLDGILYKAYAGMSSSIVPIHPTNEFVGILGTKL